MALNSLFCADVPLSNYSLTHISVTVHKSTHDTTIRAFIPVILLNLSLRHCDSTFLFRLWIYVTLMTILILTN